MTEPRRNYLTFPEQVDAVQMRNRGRSTYEIAKHFVVPESLIANKLRHWREAFRTQAPKKESA